LFHEKPIIGIAGGIGSGKSTVARRFGEIGCLVIDSDEQVRQAYKDPEVLLQLRSWWGREVLLPDGSADRSAIAKIVFADPGQRERLEEMIHPKVNELRHQKMLLHANDPQVLAIVWDTPLLFEVGLNRHCDAVVFVDCPLAIRLKRVKDDRKWGPEELARREKLQWPLDRKREISDYSIDNTADADNVRGQVREVLFRILARRFPEKA